MRALVVGRVSLHTHLEALRRFAVRGSMCSAHVDLIPDTPPRPTHSLSRMTNLLFEWSWRSAAEVAGVRRAGHNPADVVVTNGPIGWGMGGSRAGLHLYHQTHRGSAASAARVDGISHDLSGSN